MNGRIVSCRGGHRKDENARIGASCWLRSLNGKVQAVRLVGMADFRRMSSCTIMVVSRVGRITGCAATLTAEYPLN